METDPKSVGRKTWQETAYREPAGQPLAEAHEKAEATRKGKDSEATLTGRELGSSADREARQPGFDGQVAEFDLLDDVHGLGAREAGLRVQLKNGLSPPGGVPAAEGDDGMAGCVLHLAPIAPPGA